MSGLEKALTVSVLATTSWGVLIVLVELVRQVTAL